MKVAVVHPHYRRGGVTRVVENAVAALGPQSVEVLALCGDDDPSDALPHHAIVEGLAYDTTPRPGAGKVLAARLRAAARAALGAEPDLWHFHNHSLGKNVHLPAAIRILAQEGARILLQIHDFAEDGRPGNYTALRAAYPISGTLSQVLYPAAPQVHYAVLNGRDAGVLRGAGVPTERCHLLPNPIAVPRLRDGGAKPLPEAERLFLYPTRAIRRKNVGEMLLHAALAPSGTVFGTTLRPENPEWKSIHEAWEMLAHRLQLPVQFGLGETHPFDTLVRRADAFITTSVAEGFGLAFLEPALFGKPLVGRNLPAITNDFRAWGIDLDHLYTALPVPTHCIDADLARSHIADALERLGRAYATPYSIDAVDEALAAMRTGDGGWDFGRLDEALQTGVIEAAVATPDAFAAVARILGEPTSPALVKTHQQAISEHLNLERYGARLQALYTQLGSAPSGKVGAYDARAVLGAFLDPRNLNLLRS